MAQAGNFAVSWPDFVQADEAFVTVAFDGGWWEPDLPLANLRDRLQANAARSVNLALTSTRFWVDLGQARDVRLFAIPDLVSSPDLLWRLRAFDAQDEGGTALLDTGWLEKIEPVYGWGTLPWGHPSLYDGKETAEDLAGQQIPIYRLLDTPVSARWWLVELDDTDGELDYVEVPRIILSRAVQLTMNFGYGAQQSWEDPTGVETSLGGVDFFDVQPGRRAWRFGIDYLPEAEAQSLIMRMVRQLGVSGQLFLVWNPADTLYRRQRSGLYRMRALSPLEYACFGRQRATFELIEQVG